MGQAAAWAPCLALLTPLDVDDGQQESVATQLHQMKTQYCVLEERNNDMSSGKPSHNSVLRDVHPYWSRGTSERHIDDAQDSSSAKFGLDLGVVRHAPFAGSSSSNVRNEYCDPHT